jgi:hypothetical protein
MAITKEQIAALYVAAFQRAPAKNELDGWYEIEKDKESLNDVAADMLYAAYTVVNKDVDLAKIYPIYTELKDVTLDIETLEKFVEGIYKTLFGKGLKEDKKGIDGWVSKIIKDGGTFEALGKTLAGIVWVADRIANGEEKADEETVKYAKAFQNRVKVAAEVAEKVSSNDLDGDGKPDIAAFQNLIARVNDNPDSVKNVEAVIEDMAKKAETVKDKNVIKITEEHRSYNGTEGDDYYDATGKENIIAGKIINDPSDSDNDILKAYVKDEVSATIMNVENVQMVGKYSGYTLNAGTFEGVKELDLSTEIGGKPVTVKNVRADGIEAIKVEDSISKATIQTDTSGTHGELKIKANTEVELDGADGKDDEVTVEVGKGKTVDIGKGLGDDDDLVKLALFGDGTIKGVDSGTLNTLSVDVGNGERKLTIENLPIETLNLKGKKVTIDDKNANLSGKEIKEDGDVQSAVVVNRTDTSAQETINAKKWGVDQILLNKDLSGDSATNYLALSNVKESTTVVVAADQTKSFGLKNGDVVNLDMQKDINSLIVDGTKTLKVNAAGGSFSSSIDLKSNMDAIIVKGDKDISLGEVEKATGVSADIKVSTIKAENYFSNLNVTSGIASTIVGGYGDDSITSKKADGITVDGGAGNDIIKQKSASNINGDTTLKGGLGNDTIEVKDNVGENVNLVMDGGDGNDTLILNNTTNSSDVSIVGGSGDDVIKVLGGFDTGKEAKVSLGDGKDLLIVKSGSPVDVADFSTTNDKIELISDGFNNDLNLKKADVDKEKGISTLNDITLEKVTSEDWSSFVQLGDKNKYFVIDANNKTVTGSANDDFVKIKEESKKTATYQMYDKGGFDTIKIDENKQSNYTGVKFKLEGENLVGTTMDTAENKGSEISKAKSSLTNLSDKQAIVEAIGNLSQKAEKDHDYILLLTGSGDNHVNVAGGDADDIVIFYIHPSKDYNNGDSLKADDIVPLGVIVDVSFDKNGTTGLNDDNFDYFTAS